MKKSLSSIKMSFKQIVTETNLDLENRSFSIKKCYIFIKKTYSHLISSKLFFAQ